LRNGELASLAYGSFKELLKFKELLLREEPRQGGLVARYRFVFGRFMACFTVRSRFVFGSSSARYLRYIGRWFKDIGRSFYGILDAGFMVYWTLFLRCLSWGPTFDHEGVLAIEMWNRSEISRDHGPLVSCSCTRRSHGILPRVHFRHAVYLTYPE
jgi:hypothetical protein